MPHFASYLMLSWSYRFKSKTGIPTHLEQNPDSVRGIPFQPVQIHEVVPHFGIRFLELLEQRGAELAEIAYDGRALVGIQFLQSVVAFSVEALLDDMLLYADEIGYGCDEFFGIDGHGSASLHAINSDKCNISSTNYKTYAALTKVFGVQLFPVLGPKNLSPFR